MPCPVQSRPVQSNPGQAGPAHFIARTERVLCHAHTQGEDTSTPPCLSLLCRDDATAVLRSDPKPRMRSSTSRLRPPSPCAGDDDAPSGGRPPSFHHCSAADGGSDLQSKHRRRRQVAAGNMSNRRIRFDVH